MASSQALRRLALLTLLPVSALLLSGCWDEGHVVVPPFFTLGGAVTGLNSDGLVLGNGTNRLPVSAGASAVMMPGAARRWHIRHPEQRRSRQYAGGTDGGHLTPRTAAAR